MTHTHQKHDKPKIGITLGDLNGIGPEVVLKALADNRTFTGIIPVIYGSTRTVTYFRKSLNMEDFNFNQVKARGQFVAKQVNVVNCWEDNIEINPGKPSKETARAAAMALKQATLDVQEGIIDGLVTAPIDKDTIYSDDFPYKGHTEFLSKIFGKESLMMMVNDTLKVGLVTDHVSLAEVPALITTERVTSKLNLLEQSLKKDFGKNRPRIAVLGLNPHAGDNGLMGKEDDTILKPLVHDLKSKGKLVFGPYPADGFFGAGMFAKFDGVLAMYHDQGLIPFKLLAFEEGVNYTAGLPIIRTSPDHGTAYSIAGKNQANESSVRYALYQALDIIRRRNEPSTEK